MNDLFLQILLLLVAAIGAQWVAWRLHTPAILFLLALGFILGPVLGLLHPQMLLGELLGPAIAVAVAIILFEGALQLRFTELRETRGPILRIILLGGPIGCVLISAGAYYIGGLELPVAITLGGMLIVTGPTVIMPMLRQARLNMRLGSILKWEGIVNDPIGVLVAVLAYGYFAAQNAEGTVSSGYFIWNTLVLLLVSAFSVGAAHLIKYMFAHGHMPEYLKAPFILTTVLVLFYASNLLLHESGLIAVTLLGLMLANIHMASIEEIKRFKETITLLLVSGVFLLLTANLDVSALLELNIRSVLFIFALLFIIRPLTVALCSIGADMNWREILLIGWIAPRGVVCAAMAGVLGPSLVEAGFEDGHQVMPIAFMIVVLSVIFHSLTIKPLAERLKLKTTESNGLIITGTHNWTLQLAEVLKSRNVPVLVVDNKFSALKQARMMGLPTYYGELLSDEAEFRLEFVKYNSLLATTYSPAYNALVCDKFGYEFGRERVLRVPPDSEEKQQRITLSQHIRGKLWARNDFSNEGLQKMYQEGWRFRTTRVGAKMKEEEKQLILPKETDTLIIVGVISKNGGVRLRAAELNLNPKENDLLLLFSNENGVVKEAT